ncbi:MAG TPA: NrfD/PsrC family molybdoenzyme membrane anchor subunit, partial [Urbifossiella sp.]|nr:NrfD/PsrC family molybdoenzyme membrane anchor subunit [Urbifossiella sp.]
AIGGLFLMVFLYAVGYVLIVGIGAWGVNIPVAWGFAIVNFVWWIGIGHAGTLISAILLLLHQKWRTSVNRFAEAMTIFAVMCAGLFPLFHLGRPWFFYWLFPYPNRHTIWPQFRSPLTWDVFAVSTYFTVSVMFWYLGMLPDIAAMRDRAQTRLGRAFYGILGLGWRSSVAHWWRVEKAYLLLAGLATPLVVSVHTVVSFDFAVGIVPGWHSTVFPPYFVAGAIYSGFAMALILAIPLRSAYGIKDFLTRRHLNNCGKLMLASGLVLTYGYFIEGVMAVYSGGKYELEVQHNRWVGTAASMYWLVITMNVIIPQALWFSWVRNNPVPLFLVSLSVLIGMWLERWVIVIGSLQRDYSPSMWGLFRSTWWDYAFLYGSIGLFFVMFALFLRFLPMLSIAELRDLLPRSQGGRDGESLKATPCP